MFHIACLHENVLTLVQSTLDSKNARMRHDKFQNQYLRDCGGSSRPRSTCGWPQPHCQIKLAIWLLARCSKALHKHMKNPDMARLQGTMSSTTHGIFVCCDTYRPWNQTSNEKYLKKLSSMFTSSYDINYVESPKDPDTHHPLKQQALPTQLPQVRKVSQKPTPSQWPKLPRLQQWCCMALPATHHDWLQCTALRHL